jgi:hypothetical protein
MPQVECSLFVLHTFSSTWLQPLSLSHSFQTLVSSLLGNLFLQPLTLRPWIQTCRTFTQSYQ